MTADLNFKNYTGPISPSERLDAVEEKTVAHEADIYRSCYIDPDAVSDTNFAAEEHRILWNYWQKLRGSDKIPTYDWINPADFNKAMGYVLLMEPNDDFSDFKYRVYGSRIANRFGHEMNGRWTSEFYGVQKDISITQYSLSAKKECPVYSEHSYVNGEDEYARTLWCRLIMPMKNKDGKIDRILVGNYPDDIGRSDVIS